MPYEFTVEENRQYKTKCTAPWVIRCHPNPGGTKNPDGSTSHSMNFPALVATDFLSGPEKVLQRVADILNKHWDEEQGQ